MKVHVDDVSPPFRKRLYLFTNKDNIFIGTIKRIDKRKIEELNPITDRIETRIEIVVTGTTINNGTITVTGWENIDEDPIK